MAQKSTIRKDANLMQKGSYSDGMGGYTGRTKREMTDRTVEKEELMKKNCLQIMVALTLLLSVSLLTACGSPAAQEEAEEQKLATAVETDVIPEIEENMPEAPAEGYAELTL